MPKYKPSTRLLIPGNQYQATVMAAEDKLSKAGNETIELKLRVEPSGEIVYDHLVFTEQAAWWIGAFYNAINQVVPEDGVDITGRDFVGCRARVVVGVKEFNGRERFYVKEWL